MMELSVFTFKACYGGIDRHPQIIRVIAQQKSTAWVDALEQAGRQGPIGLFSLQFVAEQDLPNKLDKEIQDIQRNGVIESVEASTLGWGVGKWPETFSHNGFHYKQERKITNVADDFLGFVYRSEHGQIHVLND